MNPVRPLAGRDTLVELLRERAARRPDDLGYLFLADGEVESERLTYGELDRRARAVAGELLRAAAPGDRALLLFRPGLDFVAAFFGCLYAGLVAVPIPPPNFRKDPSRFHAVVRDCEPRVALSPGALAATAAGAGPASLRWIATDGIEADASSAWADPGVGPETVAFLQYTSGSTGDPRGVIVTHGNLAHNEEAIRRTFGQSRRSRIVGWLPVYHDMGLIGNVLQPLWVGATCILMSPVSFLQRPRRWLEAISRYRATTSGGPNFAYDLCARRIPPAEREGLDLSCWKVAFNGAEPVRAETLERFAEAFAPAGFSRGAFCPCYGLAEATLLVSGTRHGDPHRTSTVDPGALVRHRAEPAAGAGVVLAGSGRPVPGQQILVVDPETHRPSGRGEVGEIWVRGPSVARGYWERPEESAETFQAMLESGEGPFLRTGDLGFLAGSELFVTGRLKDLIILRGRNHYPQDIERTVEGRHPLLRPNSAAAFPVDALGEERLVVVQELEPRTREISPADASRAAEEVRRAVAEEHEAQVYELVLIPAGALPRTTSGKVRRRACRELLLSGELPVLARCPWRAGARAEEAQEAQEAGADGMSAAALRALDPSERTAVLAGWLRQRAAGVLGVDVDPARPLPALGLDSLAAVELGHRIEATLGVAPSPSDLLAGSTVTDLAAELAQRIEAAEAGAEAPPEDREPPELGDHPPSSGQEALWFLERLAPGSGAYHIVGTARAAAPLDRPAFERALRRLPGRHPALRTVLVATAGTLVQRVLPDLPPEVLWEDASESDEDAALGRLEEVLGGAFDLELGPLVRAAVLSPAAGAPLVGLALHHVAADFWSLAVLVRDLGALYSEESGGPPAPPAPPAARYTTYASRQARWLESPDGVRSRAWWHARLAGAPVLDMPTDRPRPPVQTYRGGARRSRLEAPLVARLGELARREGATFFMGLLAAFQALLGRYSGQDDLVVGSPAAGRSSGGFADAVGYFVNPLPLRADLSGDPSFAELLARTRERCLGAFEHQAYPFARIAAGLQPERDPARPPLFQAQLVLHKASREDRALAAFAVGEPGARLDLGGLPLESLPRLRPAAQLELTLAAAVLGDDVALCLEHNADLFDPATTDRILGHLGNLLRAAAARPETSVTALPLLSPAEREELILAGGTPAAEVAADACLHVLVRAQARRTPDAVAVTCGDERLTYGELASRAGRLARRLAGRGVGPEVTVALASRRTPGLVAAILGVLEAGGAYVPLDPDYPRERLAFMLADSGAAVLVTEDSLLAALPPFAGPVVLLDRPEDPGQPAAPPSPTVGSGNLAYLIYTSGSTGRPKGVAIEHRSAVALLHWVRETFSPGELSGILASTSVCFDLSVFELFAPLSTGGLVILAANALELPRLAAAREVTLVNTVPSAVAELASRGEIPPSVRTVALAGEPLPGPLVRRIEETATVERVLNLYGPSEDTTYSTWAEVRGGDRPPAIGRPVRGTRAHVLDPRLEPVPPGVAGELYLGGAGLARGYHGRPGLTADRFVPDPWSALAGEDGARLYRTGDLVRRRADGELEFLGRYDHQVKVRGFRVELGEIEAVLARHPAVRQAAALAVRETPGGEARLVAWVGAPGAGETLRRELVERLREALPRPVQPQALVILDALPLTPSGKIDRRALPEPAFGAGPAASPGHPRSPVEEVVAQILAGVLGVERIGRRDDFFAAGGHSLLAARALARIERVLAVDLPLVALFQSPTVEDLARRLEERLAQRPAGSGARVSPPPLVAVPRSGPMPLSFAQQRLWFLHQLEPASAAYHVPGALELSGALGLKALAASLREIVRRHEALRTSFPSAEAGPVQAIAPPPVALPLPMVDLAGLPEPARAREATRSSEELARRPFDLARGPLVRWSVLRLGPLEHRLAVVFHHIVSDGASFELFLTELASLYGALAAGRSSPLAEIPIQYADFAAWQRRVLSEEAIEEPLHWWRERLDGVPVLELPTDRPRHRAAGDRGAHRSFDLSGAAVLGPLCREEGATLYTALLAVLSVVLARLARQDDVAVGTPVSARGPVETEGLIGLFVNTLVLRTRVDGALTGRELLRRARDTVLEAHARSGVPFERIVDELQPERTLHHAPLFQVMLAHLHTGAPRLAAGDLEIRFLEVATRTAKFDLSLWVRESGGRLSGHLVYRSALWDASTMARLERYLLAVASGLAEEPDRPARELPMLSAGERHQIVAEWNATRARVPAGRCLHDLFEERARAVPEAPALLTEDGPISFRELNRRANRAARRLRELGVGPDVLVGIEADRSPEMVVALLAAWKAGGAYLPLDPTHPRERVAAVLEDAGARVLVLRPGLLPEPPGTQALGLEVLSRPGTPSDDDDLPAIAAPENLAYVLYTSGSTGRPKGTMIAHRSVVNLAFALRRAVYEGLAPPLRVGVNASLAFDATVKQIVQLLDGHALSVLPEDVRLDGRRLIAHARERRLDVVDCTPSQLRLILDAASGAAEGAAGLPRFLVGGEAIEEPLWRELAASGGFWNLYGPTECTVDATACRARGERPVLGRPLDNVRVHVLDGTLRPLPTGVGGELCIAGAGLARGYRGSPGRTAERFVPNPLADHPGERLYRTGDLARWLPGGVLEFLGREDDQVKIRGYRVELGEVEAVLAEHPAVRRAVVLHRLAAAGERRLVAYIEDGGGSTDEELRAFLGRRLPEPMVPARWVRLERFPLTPNGKIDRRALPDPAAPEDRERVAPRSALEERLAEVWRSLLGVEAVGVRDDFFELGGHSLLAAQVASRVRQVLGVEVPLRALFESPTIEGLAGVIETLLASCESSEGSAPRRDAPIRARSRGRRDLSRLLEEMDGLPAARVRERVGAGGTSVGRESP